MNQNPSHDLIERFGERDTPELIELMKRKATATQDGKDDAELTALQQVLETRQARFPDGIKRPPPAVKPADLRPLAADSNAIVGNLKPEKIVISFPEAGFIQCNQSVFKNQADLVAYIADVLSLKDKRGAARLGVWRKGKYQRVDRAGSPVYTFGDPILDLVTDEYGWVTVGRETYNLLARDLASPQNRKGGVTSIDLSVNHEDIRRQQLADALAVNGTRTLIEHTNDQLSVASTNPSELNFWKGSAHMRFRSWKKNYGFYKSIGTEIETWGGDFQRAEIQSIYADPVVPNTNPFICAIVKRDSDSDTNDDYVDEYEYSFGLATLIPSTVRSFCQANWKGQLWGGTVTKGDCQTFL
jgi:hypothetical protein